MGRGPLFRPLSRVLYPTVAGAVFPDSLWGWGMRNVLAICIRLIALYGVDRIYFDRFYTAALVTMLRQIGVGYK